MVLFWNIPYCCGRVQNKLFLNTSKSRGIAELTYDFDSKSEEKLTFYTGV